MKVSPAAIGLKKLRERAGMSVREVAAALDRPASSYASYEDKFKKPFLPMELASALVPIWSDKGIARGEILKLAGLEMEGSGNISKLEGLKVPSITEPPQKVPSSDDLLRVIGMGHGGLDGWSPWNGEIVQYIQRPDNLRGVPNAYAVFVTGTSVSPRYEPGEVIHVHPGRPVLPGAWVLVQRRPRHEGEPPLAIIKRLVRRSATKITLEQLTPPKRFDVPADDIVSIHRIVGSSEA